MTLDYPLFKQRTSCSQLFSRRWLCSLALGVSAAVVTAMPLKAAEKIYFLYSPLIESLQISSLTAFAESGTIEGDLAFYLNLAGANEEDKKQFRELLTKRIEVEPVVLSRLLKTDEGERLLNFFGKFINIQGGRNGFYVLRGAMVLAAFDAEGLTLLNVLRQLGTNVQLDVRKAQILAKDIDLIVEGTKQFAAEIAQLSAQEIASQPDVNFAQLPDLRRSGTFGIKKQTWTLTDASRERTFYVDVYRPERWRPGKTPVVIISHGLSSKPEDFADKAKHLASYGFVVVLPQHPGSDARYAEGFRAGYHRDLSSLNAFIDRPKDISYTLDELERRNSTEFESRLNLDEVGIYGHSYGGYTALALAGANPTPNFAQLERDCALELLELNTALLLQCRALKLNRQEYNFRDERIQAVIAANAVNASILGERGMSQIQIPVALGAGSYDPATPFLFEQARSFPWLTASERYLVLEQGQTHIDLSKLDGGASRLLKMVPDLDLPSPQLLSEYGKALTLAFFEVYIANNAGYRLYLQPSYAAYLSQREKFKTYMITGASSEKLIRAIERWKQEHRLGETATSSKNQ